MASKGKHIAAPQPAAPVVSAPPQQPAASVVSVPPQQQVAPEVSAPPQQPAAPDVEVYDRDDFQWEIPTSSQVAPVDPSAATTKYLSSKKLFDSQETTEEETHEEAATAAAKNMLSSNTLRATANTAMDGPVVHPKKRKRPAKKGTKAKEAAKSKDTIRHFDKLPNNWRPQHWIGEPMLPEHVDDFMLANIKKSAILIPYFPE
nr:fruit protein pKIWI501-like [Lolium perenne]